MRTPPPLPISLSGHAISLFAAATLLGSTAFAKAPAFAESPERLWSLLSQVRFEEHETPTNWSVEKTFPEALRSLDGPVTIRGYPVTVLAEAKVTTFLLVQDPADCPFCGGNAGYGPTLEVHLSGSVEFLDETRPLNVTGQLDLIMDDDTYQAFRLIDAHVAGP